MLDPKLLRNDLHAVAEELKRRGYVLDAARYLELEDSRKFNQTHMQELRNIRNARSKEIGNAKAHGQDTTELMKSVNSCNELLIATEEVYAKVEGELERFYLQLPNLLDRSVPDGNDESANVVVREHKSQRELINEPKDHIDLGENLGLLDAALAAKISGSRFTVIKGPLARLHRALTQFMLDLHTSEHGYEEVYVPYIVNAQSLRGTGQLPKFEEDLFGLFQNSGQHAVFEARAYYLVPTAEVPVTNFARDEIYEENTLPRRYVAHTPCFRAEAGSAGKDTRGMIRQHQFEKVELVHIVRPQDSDQALEDLTKHAEQVLKKLDITYRVVALCSGDIGFSAAKTYDLEVWLPSQKRYREISSCSNCKDFQARRMQARWRNPETGKPELLHTLNGSGVAVGRALIAIMENYQNGSGDIEIPKVLQRYMNGAKLLSEVSKLKTHDIHRDENTPY